MPADILSAILLLPDLRALQTCSIPSTTYAPPPFQPRLRSLRILRLRSLDEARTVAGILHACRDTLACISIRVAERDDLADNVINDLEPRLWNPAPQNEDDGDEIDLTTTNLKSQFLHVLLTNPSSSEPLKLKIESLALFNFPRLNLDFLSSIVRFSGLHTLRLDTMDNQVLSTLSRDTVLPPVMKVLDLTFGKAAFPLAPTAATPEPPAHEGQPSEIENRPPMMSTLLRDLRAVENLNLKLFCEPLTEGRVMSEYIAPWLLSLNSSSNSNNINAREKHRYHQYHAHHHHLRHLRHSQRRQSQHDSRRHTQTHRRNQSTCTACAAAAAIATPSTPPVHLKKLSIHIWSIAAGQSIALAPWSLQDLQTLATSAAGRHIRSLAIDFSRHVIAFEDLVSHMQKLPALQHLYLNYTPTTYYGMGVYDVCRRQATILKAALPGLELLWMNSIELVVPIRCKRSPSPSVSESNPRSTSTASNSGVSTPVVTERSVVRSGGVDGEAIERLATEGLVSNDDHHSIDDDEEYAYDEEFEDDYEEEEEEYEETAGYDEHFGDEFFADDNNFHIFATKLF
ncbi:hypothetical protein BZA70DRAFT_282001 [Myxozyma melibiosi]|uniref:F-box domain-containing protein n=1 Tax=Myxozyma melibiosi TaxID=54550 RepID=A0ABR1F1M7_9ASCO